jgi:hypothetical protein
MISPRENVYCCGVSLYPLILWCKDSKRSMPDPLVILQSDTPYFYGNLPGTYTEFSLFSPPLLNFHLRNDTSVNNIFSKRFRRALRSWQIRSSVVCQESSVRHDFCSLTMCTLKRHHHRDGNHTDKRCWNCGSRGRHTLFAPHFFAHGGKQYGSGVVDRINHTLTGRSAYLGLSLVRLWSLGHCRGATDCPHRVALYWPNMKGGSSIGATPPLIPL